MLALLMSLPLAGCGPSSSPKPTARALPELPAFAQPVDVPEPRKGQSLAAIAARERAGRVAANGRIIGLRSWYGDVKQDYAR